MQAEIIISLRCIQPGDLRAGGDGPAPGPPPAPKRFGGPPAQPEPAAIRRWTVWLLALWEWSAEQLHARLRRIQL